MGRARGIVPASEHDMETEHAVRAQITRLKEEIADRTAHLKEAQRCYREIQTRRRKGTHAKHRAA